MTEFKVGDWVKVRKLKYDAWWRNHYIDRLGKVINDNPFSSFKSNINDDVIVAFGRNNTLTALYPQRWLKKATKKDIQKYLIDILI